MADEARRLERTAKTWMLRSRAALFRGDTKVGESRSANLESRPSRESFTIGGKGLRVGRDSGAGVTARGCSVFVGIGDFGVQRSLGGTGTGASSATTAKDEHDADGDDGARERPGDVHPVGGEVGGDEVGSEGA